MEKDNSFNRTKAYNVVEVLNIKLDDHEHYRRRLINLGNGNTQQFKQSRYKPKQTKIKKEEIQDLGDGVYAVQSQSDSEIWHTTNLWSGYCTCMGGRNCGPCVHKHAVAEHFQTSMFSVLPSMDANMKALCHLIATGTAQEETWYRTPDNPDPNVNQFIQNYEDRCASAADHHQEHQQHQEPEHEEHEHDEHEVDNIEDNDEEDDDERGAHQEEVLQNLTETMDELQKMLYDNIEDPSVLKCTEYFTTQIRKGMRGGNLQTLTRTLYQIGGVAAPRGEKRKNSGTITIQAASKSRRRFRHRGSGAATSGRKVKDMPSHSQAFSEEISDEEEVTFNNKKSLKHDKLKQLFPVCKSNHSMKKRNQRKFKVNYARTERYKRSPIVYMQNLLNDNDVNDEICGEQPHNHHYYSLK